MRITREMDSCPSDLKDVNVTDLEVFANPSDLRQDLHVLVDYTRNHEIKRGHRTNLIPRGHQERLAKLMSDPASASQMNEEGSSSWIEHVDWICLALKFIATTPKGSMQATPARRPRFPTTTLTSNEKRYEQFLRLSLQQQEEAILEFHLGDPSWRQRVLQPRPLEPAGPV